MATSFWRYLQPNVSDRTDLMPLATLKASGLSRIWPHNNTTTNWVHLQNEINREHTVPKRFSWKPPLVLSLNFLLPFKHFPLLLPSHLLGAHKHTHYSTSQQVRVPRSDVRHRTRATSKPQWRDRITAMHQRRPGVPSGVQHHDQGRSLNLPDVPTSGETSVAGVQTITLKHRSVWERRFLFQFYWSTWQKQLYF